MPRAVEGRMTATVDGEFAVSLIGMRVTKLWAAHRWWPVFVAMPRFGLAAAGEHVPVNRVKDTARDRLHA